MVVMNRIENIIIIVISLLFINISSFYNFGKYNNYNKNTLLLASRDKIGIYYTMLSMQISLLSSLLLLFLLGKKDNKLLYSKPIKNDNKNNNKASNIWLDDNIDDAVKNNPEAFVQTLKSKSQKKIIDNENEEIFTLKEKSNALNLLKLHSPRMQSGQVSSVILLLIPILISILI